MRTVRSPKRDTIRALFSGAHRYNLSCKWACAPFVVLIRCEPLGGMHQVIRILAKCSETRELLTTALKAFFY